MPAQRPQLAKLTRPHLARAVARERLFARLDEERQRAHVICVVGPPGAGKTTLVASWLDAAGIKGIWYQVDAGDADLPTFFHYLGQAAVAFTRKRQQPLPALTPEYLHDVPGFARRFFRELFARLPKGSTLVLDNYQEVDAEQAFHQVVADAVGEVPLDMTLIAVSRRDPPDCYARLIANENVAMVHWEALKLTLDEAQAIGRRRGNLDVEQIRAVHARSDGWAAGFTLMLERQRHGESPSAGSAPDSMRDVFNYFAGQLFDRAEVDAQRLLLELSFLPRMSASAVRQLTGGDAALQVLDDLYRRHLFTDRRMTGEPVYQFHALLQAFLQHRALRVLSLPQQVALFLRAGQAAEQAGQAEEALPLYLRAGALDRAQLLILREAPRLIGQGRWRVVVDWIEALPEVQVHSDRWLMHWLGTAWLGVDPPKARALLEQCHELAKRATDTLCRMQAAAGIIQTYMLEYARYRPIDPWIDVLLEQLDSRPDFPNVDAELRVQAALLIALTYRRPDHPHVESCAERVFHLVQGEAELNLRVLATAYLVVYGGIAGPFDIALRTRPLLERLLQQPGVTALTRGWGWFIVCLIHVLACDEQACGAEVTRIEAIGVEEGLPAVVGLAAVLGCTQALGMGDAAAAEEWIRRLDQVTVPGHLYDMGSLASLKAHLALLRGDVAGAREPAAQAVAIFEEAGTHFHRFFTHVDKAWTLMDRPAEAEKEIAEALRLALETKTQWCETEVRLTHAFLLLRQGDRAAAMQSLRRAFEVQRLTECRWPFRFLRPRATWVCTEALAADIEVDYVRDLVRRIRVDAPSIEVENWPWPIKVFTLGQFRLLIDDQPLSFSHKVPRKPIALLKAIVAMGVREVRAEKLMDALWPQESGDAAHEAFGQALLRLRRLLGTARAVHMAEGRVSLEESLVWTDVRAFEACAANGAADEAAHRALALYRGEFLADETDHPWTASLRERLRGKFLHMVSRAGMQLESAQQWDEALALYLRGLDADSLSESFYQGLMRCYAARGMHAEALSIYRRLRQQLSIVLGMQPSATSEALARELRLR